MAANSGIEWTDHTFNPWLGCTEISPACDHCYARTLMDTRWHRVKWGAGQPRVRTSAENWKQPLKWNVMHLNFRGQYGRRQRVFCSSLADVFDNEVDPQWRIDLFDLIRQTPHLDWLLLTKRIGNVRTMVPNLPFNVWIGATVCNQEEVDRDVPKLLAINAKVRFLSCEPLLGPLNLRAIDVGSGVTLDGLSGLHAGPAKSAPLPKRYDGGIDWVICGGESGHGARHMESEWARSLLHQCRTTFTTSFFMKQMGGARDKRGAITDLDEDLRVREFPV